MPQNTIFLLFLMIHGLLSNGLLHILPEDWLNRYADFQRVARSRFQVRARKSGREIGLKGYGKWSLQLQDQ
ncbi:hypothetical protein Ddye_015930 [Dipteronia dyeriana]|uniref:Uncharacterized protein n=1 Tax=Dipteronia dyeriana TaxID=168575 RepID=A0AAD9U6I0_9ROSI|nr:hypothetical protein Ddye_015930 [Dipteronia dyeriana]